MGAAPVRDHLSLLLLALLGSGPAHGYSLMVELRSRSSGFLNLPEGSIYPALHSLEEARLVRSRQAYSGGRRRRTYEITARGKGSWQSRGKIGGNSPAQSRASCERSGFASPKCRKTPTVAFRNPSSFVEDFTADRLIAYVDPSAMTIVDAWWRSPQFESSQPSSRRWLRAGGLDRSRTQRLASSRRVSCPDGKTKLHPTFQSPAPWLARETPRDAAHVVPSN